jgi:hypothetical protein
MSSSAYSDSSGSGSEVGDVSNVWEEEAGGDAISGYTRELIALLDPQQKLHGVDLNSESNVRQYMEKRRQDSVINTIIRLRKLKKLMSSIFTSAEVRAIDEKLARCMSAMKMDKSHAEALILINERHQMLDKFVDDGLLFEHEDNELFNLFVKTHVGLVKSSK